MSARTYELLDGLLLVAFVLGLTMAGIYLVITEHYGWAWIPFLLCFCVSRSKKDSDEPTES